MKGELANVRVYAHTTPSLLDRRMGTERRLRYCQVSYTYEAEGVTHTEEGFARDFSNRVCLIRGRASPHVGSKTALTLYFLDRKPPLCFDATVICVAGDYFGVEFPSLGDDDYDRMQRFMRRVLYR